MTEEHVHQCSWVGVDPTDEGNEIPCGKPASYFIEEASGRRVYACLEHLGHAKSQAPMGHEVHEIQVRNHQAPSVRSAIRME